jgi:hypothetical protein
MGKRNSSAIHEKFEANTRRIRNLIGRIHG